MVEIAPENKPRHANLEPEGPAPRGPIFLFLLKPMAIGVRWLDR
jgi:hypothetical protein